jgi:nonribosomal peptide synthetase DhbF
MSELASPLCLDHQFVEQSSLGPDRIALFDSDDAITYAELVCRSARGAAALSARGIGSGAIVGLHLERSIDWVAATLAILRAGAAVMPLPPSYPTVRLREIVGRAGLAAIIDNRTTPFDPALGQRILDCDGLWTETSASAPAVSLPVSMDPDRPAFVLCSSGSTGLPKMIVRSHRSFQHRLAWTWTNFPFAAAEVGCHKAHTTTTHGIYELFEPLLSGAPTLILADGQVRDLEQFWMLVRARGVSRLLVVPSAMQASLDLPGFEPPPLKLVVLMGEHLPFRLARRIVEAFPTQTSLYSIYGSTEASSTIACNLRKCARSDEELPLGQPITPDVGVRVLNGKLEPVEPGQSGRLYITGPALFSGYLGQPELTAQVVIRHPRNGELLYDTRDDVRCVADGNIVFVGRTDDTVKIRGFRVELAEVERAINACPGVAQAAVVVCGGNGADAALIGFFTPRAVPVQEVFRSLRERLPPYMIPAALHGLDTFPLTERSKLDRKRLLAEYLTLESDQPDQASFSELEKRIALSWERTLGHRQFGRDSSFFEVGGTSLTTAVLVHRLREDFGFDREGLPEHSVYRFPTVAAMARLLGGSLDLDVDQATRLTSILVTLRRSQDATAPPLFCIASAGGTLGAYRKVAAALRYGGEIVGVRDPYVSGERDPTESFDRWVQHYLDAMTARWPNGPYCIAAYSSAGAFGIELAQRLRHRGSAVALLALIDPLGIDGGHWHRYGWWVLLSTHSGPWIKSLTRIIGALRGSAGGVLRALGKMRNAKGFALSADEFRQLSHEMATSRARLLALAALMELNTGLPLDLSDVDVPSAPSDGTLRALQARVAAVMPEFDSATIKRIASQYALQLLAQRAYALAPYDGPTLLVEPVSEYVGLVQAQLRPFFRDLHVAQLNLGPTDERTRAIARRFGPWIPHFLCMRDDQFAELLARELERALAADMQSSAAAVGGMRVASP